MTEVYTHPQHPTVMIIREKWTKDEIAAVLGNSNFTAMAIQGRTCPEYPFTPPA